MQPCIQAKEISLTFRPKNREPVSALKELSLDVGKGEFVSIVGPSGCGKSTFLNILLGLIKPDAGEMQLNGTRITGPGQDRAMVFQEFGLLPWRTVIGNVELGLELKGVHAEARRKRATDLIQMAGLAQFENHYPHELSGGMKQKVAIARALANDPEVILMDEPFASLDAQTRLLMREELLRIWERDKKTVILVTHNIDEAVMLCDRIAVMSSRPGLIKSVVNVDVPRPRNFKSMKDPDFADCTEKIWNLLKYDVEHAMDRPHP